MPTMRFNTNHLVHPTLFAAVLAVSTLIGCSDNAKDPATTADDGPLYVIASEFSAGDESETYLVTTSTFDESTTLDPTNGPKLLGGIVPLVHGGSVYVPDSNGPVLLRYQPGADGVLESTAEVSFAGVGMTEIMSWHVYAVSDTLGYVFDPAGLRIVIWNPQRMELTGEEIDLSSLARDGWVPNLVFEHSGPARRGSELLIPLGWVDQDANSRHAAGVVVLDTKTNAIIDVAEDERCGESYASVEAPNGDVYFFPPDWSSLPHYFVDLFQPTCVLRVRAGETSFDTEALDLSALGSGSAAAGAVPDGNTGFLFTTVDEGLRDESEDAVAVWRFWHYDFETEKSRSLDDMPVWSGQPYYVNVGGQAFIPYWTETSTGARTTFYRVNGGNEPTELFSFDANWYGAAKLR
jgi:hypothetical protein